MFFNAFIQAVYQVEGCATCTM